MAAPVQQDAAAAKGHPQEDAVADEEEEVLVFNSTTCVEFNESEHHRVSEQTVGRIALAKLECMRLIRFCIKV